MGPKINVALNIPCILEFKDYHEIPVFLDYLHQLSPKFKCEELMGSCYSAIVYVGKNKKYRALIRKFKEDNKEND